MTVIFLCSWRGYANSRHLGDWNGSQDSEDVRFCSLRATAR